MELEVSLPHSQMPTTCPYPAVVRNIKSMPPYPTFWKSIFISSIYAQVFQVVYLVCSHQYSPPQPSMHLTFPLYVLRTPSISFFSIWSPEQYVVRRTDH